MAGYTRGDDELDDLQDFALDGENEEAEGTNILMVVVVSLLFLVAFGCVVWVAYNNGVAHGRDEARNQTTIPEPYNETTKVADAGKGDATKAGSVARLVAQSMQKKSEQHSATVAPAPAPAVKPQTPPRVIPQPRSVPAAKKNQRRVVEPAPAAKTVVKNVPKTKPAAVAGKYALQIGAFPSAAEAEHAWKIFLHKHSGLLSGASHNIQKAVVKQKTWYRLRAGSFATRAEAKTLCAKIKAQGGACLVR